MRSVLAAGALLLLLHEGSHAASLCVAPSSYVTDCSWPHPPGEHSVYWTGFDTEEEVPCRELWPETGHGPCSRPDLPANTYGWTISSSSSDPFVNVGAVKQVDEAHYLYLWLVCTSSDGLAAVSMAFDGEIVVLETEGMNGFLQYGGGVDPNLIVGGCPVSTVLVARLTVALPTPVEPTSWGRIKGQYR